MGWTPLLGLYRSKVEFIPHGQLHGHTICAAAWGPLLRRAQGTRPGTSCNALFSLSCDFQWFYLWTCVLWVTSDGTMEHVWEQRRCTHVHMSTAGLHCSVCIEHSWWAQNSNGPRMCESSAKLKLSPRWACHMLSIPTRICSGCKRSQQPRNSIMSSLTCVTSLY